ncbi:DUF3352 domain-containing protein [Ornithinimicrobium pratense]|uniref:DUF3352 domain-containing protein n=1 Tax=Ornithinimicrobium pratense TaxID=2593973 RepID=A0A5J6V372_9MICO|nr:DUF3352 domain-containing protein [Ornithinimicrobium pratense]QFG67611.1 DUF3352 domain-containing protein [Ornithinimicrobium pratense]
MTTVTENPGGDLAESRGKKPWLLIGGGVAAAVLITGGAYAATMLGGGGDRPASVLPGGAAVYAQVDLDPDAGQKISAVRFFQGLDPELREQFSEGQWREWAWTQLRDEVDGAEDIDFATDIEPWLGDRAGLALLPQGEGEEPVVTIALQVQDGDAALAFFDERTQANDDIAYWLESDYLVFTEQDAQQTVQAAVAEGTLAENETFSSDMDDLGEAGIMAFWADTAELDDMLGAGANPAMAMTGGMVNSEMPEVAGRTAATVRLTPDAIELHGVVRGAEGVAIPENSDVDSLVTQLPADTAVAISMDNGAAMIQSAWDYYAEQNPEEVADATQQAAAEGFSLPDDIKMILGDSMSLSAGPGIIDAFMDVSPTDSGMPAVPIGYRVATDTDRLQTMLNENGLGAGVLALREDDGVLTLGGDQAYVDALADGSGDTLGDHELFTAAVADADDAQMVLFVNVNPFEEYYLPEITDTNARSALEQLGAIGISGTNENASDGHFTLRLVADPE